LISRWFVLIAVLLGVGYLTESLNEIPRRVATIWAAVTPVALIAASMATQKLAWGLPSGRASHVRSAVFAGYTQSSIKLMQLLARDPSIRIQVAGVFEDRGSERLPPLEDVALLGNLADLAHFTARENVDVVFIALPISDRRVVEMLRELRNSIASIYYIPDVSMFEWIDARPAELLGIPLLAMVGPPLGFGGRSVKRAMDVAISSFALTTLAPIMMLIAIGIKATSVGPVLFRQRRYGLNGQEILVYKFRTMFVDEEVNHLIRSTGSDRRVTPLGRMLRRTALDELPQLINVLQGTMSLVGPRPHAVAHNEQYRKLIHGYMSRHRVKPG
jgi:putative colanic acid biosynthesis UDP-glucose lipid carrier transferase